MRTNRVCKYLGHDRARIERLTRNYANAFGLAYAHPERGRAETCQVACNQRNLIDQPRRATINLGPLKTQALKRKLS